MTVAGFCCLSIFGLIALIYAVGLLNGKQTERRQNYPHAHSETAKQKAERACIGADPNAVFECVIDYVEASEETANSEQDLTAQQRAAWGALIAAFAGIASVVASILGLYWIKGTLDATRDAANQATIATTAMLQQNQISEAAQRLWVSIRAIPRFSAKVANRVTIEALIEFENLGATVAINHEVHTEILYGQGISPKSVKRLWKKWENDATDSRRALMPGEILPHPFVWHYSANDLPWNRVEGKSRRIPIALLISTHYQSAISKQGDWHHTHRAFYFCHMGDSLIEEYLEEDNFDFGPEELIMRPYSRNLAT